MSKLVNCDIQQTNKKILIIDDNKEILDSVSFLIENMGHKVYTAKNGMLGIDQYKEFRPDFVFLDVRMPVMGGCMAFDIIKKFDPDAKIIFVTAFFSDPCLDEMSKKYDFKIVEKPFEINEIEDIIKSQYR